MMKLGTMCIAACAFAFAGCAAKKPAHEPAPMPPTRATAPPPAPPSGTVGEETVTATATVQKVNLKTRHVTLKDSADGKVFTIVAGKEVRNLPQVKRGDVVTITYHESVAYRVSKAGTAKPGASASTDVSRAPLGDKPSGSVKNTVTVRTTIAAIDKAKSQVTLRDADGKMTVVKVKDPSKLDAVETGDVVDITYTEAIAVAVEKPKK
jgi:ribosomal 50S subunit-recycling heat shock protein